MPRKKSTHIPDPRALGRRLRDARERAGLSQRALAFPGCSPGYISRVEAGERTPSRQLLGELAARLGVSEEYLVTGGEAVGVPLDEAEMALRLDQPDRAAELFRAVLESDSEQTKSRALEGLGQVALRRGEPQEAVRLFDEAVALSGEDAAGRPSLAESLARAQASLGQLAEAINLLEKCVARYEDDPLQYVRFSALLGYALTDHGNFAEAERVVARALDRGRELTDPYARARLYWSEFRLQLEQGQSARAEEFGRKALETLRATEDDYAVALLHQALAHICIDLERPQEALEQLAESWPLIASAGTPLERAQYRLEEARALAALGDLDQAATLARQVTAELGETHRVDAGRSYVLVAEIFEAAGDSARAQELYELGIELLEQRGPTRYLVAAYKRLAGLLKSAGQRDEALELLERALGVQERAGRRLT